MQCGDDRLHMFNGACYLVVNYPEVTWPTAQQVCRGMKALLASIVTPEEGRFITTIIRKNAEYRTSALYWLVHFMINHLLSSTYSHQRSLIEHLLMILLEVALSGKL